MWTRLIYFVIKPLVVVVLSRLIRDGIIINSKFIYIFLVFLSLSLFYSKIDVDLI